MNLNPQAIHLAYAVYRLWRLRRHRRKAARWRREDGPVPAPKHPPRPTKFEARNILAAVDRLKATGVDQIVSAGGRTFTVQAHREPFGIDTKKRN